MDTKNLTTFIYVAELRSFTKAADRLGFSQSTVSFQIKQMENELGCQLFERINHTVQLTEKGREVLEYAHQINRMTRELKDSMKEETASGYIRLAMADSLCTSLLSRDFLHFRELYPNIALKIIAAGTEEMFRLMNHNEADAILTLDNHIYNTEYRILREEKVRTFFVAGADTEIASASSLSIEELLLQPFILTEKGMSYRRLLEEKLAELSLEIQPVLEIGSTELICSLVEQGAGISFLPEYVIKDRVKAGTLVCLPVSGLEIHVWKQLLYHRNKWVSPQMEKVLQYCVDREFR
ncbi:MAG TPA: LysR family transcriptional regulator [Candidatus Blautia stercorigallinarum]|uniref:LysR family transcriptional regulator n=1 Tax=Candidatus Blautia stercorigallinarum TaxID=2838501 RepID=A0A9D1PFC0_9FIRM|nr:LysR family transcriptional regulator [Candidatus Blautia stercorigallinarum]